MARVKVRNYGLTIPKKESAMLGRAVTVVLEDGERLEGQVWSAADPSLAGGTKSAGAWFVVVGREVFVFGGGRSAYRMERQDVGYRLGKYAGKVIVGQARGESVPDAEIDLTPVVVESPAVDVAPVSVVESVTVAPVVPIRAELEPVADVAPATVPAPMPAMTRAARKASNKELAERMRAAGLTPSGDAWRLAQSGVPLEDLAAALSSLTPASV